MNSQQWFDDLRRRLAAVGVKEAYIERLVQELQLHFQASVDRHLLGGLSEEQAEAAALEGLGGQPEIVRTTTETLRRESFIGRHRVLCLFIAPPVLMLAAQIAAVLALGLILQVHGTYHGHGYERNRFNWLNGAAQAGAELILHNIVIPLLFVRGLWKLGRRKFCGRTFTLLGCALLMVSSLNFQLKIFPAGSPPPHTWGPSMYQSFLLAVYGLALAQRLFRGKEEELPQM